MKMPSMVSFEKKELSTELSESHISVGGVHGVSPNALCAGQILFVLMGESRGPP